MKKVKVIFPDGSTAELDESQVNGAIAAGAKRFTDNSHEANTKSTSMVFPDGSIADVPENGVGGAIKAGAIKKKDGSNGTPVEQNTTSTKPVPTTLPLQGSTDPTTAFDIFQKTPTVTTTDGVQFPVTNIVTQDLVSTKNTPEAIQALQNRLINKTVTDQDVQALAQSSGKSIEATKAYITKGKDLGSAIDVTENLAKTNNEVIAGFNAMKPALGVVGTQFSADEVLGSADKSSLFLQQINNLQLSDARRKDINAFVPTPFVEKQPVIPDIPNELTQQVNNTKEALVYNIKKLTAQEANEKGLTSEQAGDLLYKRIDPTGYAQNQAMRGNFFSDKATKLATSIVGNPIQQLNGFMDWVGNKTQLDYETLNAEKSQYELAANKGLQSLAIEKKAQGIAENDQTKIDEAATLGSKIQDENAIIEKYPLLIKETMADYVNQRFAKEAGILEGTEAEGTNGQLLSIAGINRDVTKRYLKEGGFYDKAIYKDYADEVVNNPATYLADNSSLGGVGIAFLKPFKSIFNTAADLTGVRTSTDRHLENVRDEMFPERLTTNLKENISFNALGHHFNMNVSNTINSVANLGGYIAATAATAGVGRAVGASVSTAQRLGAWASFGMDAVDSGLKEADKMGLTPAQSWIFAGMKGAMMAEGGRLLEFGKGVVPTIKGVDEQLAKAAIGISDKTLTEDAAKELLNGASNAWVEGLKKYGVGTVKGAGVMTGFSVGDNLLKIGFGDKNTNPDEILPEAANAFFNGLFTMGVIGVTGIKANIENAKNSTYKGMLTKIIDNHDASADVLKIGLERGIYSQDEYNQKVQILNIGTRAKATFNEVSAQQGLNLSPEQRSVWVANTTVEKMLRQAAERDGVTESKSKDYIQQADNLVEQNTKILDGLNFNSFLEPQNDVYNAGVELKQAQADFVEKPTPENEKIVIEKKEQLEEVQSGGTIAKQVPDITVGEMVNQVGIYKGEKGSFFQDGQSVVFKVDGKDKEYELGNVDEIKDKPISDFGIEHETSVVSIDDTGGIKVRDESYVNNFSDPLSAINRDADGNVVSVNLETANGKKRTFRGSIAEDVAYQIHLKELTKDNESRTNFEQFINTDEAAKKELDNSELPETTTKNTTENNADIQQSKTEQPTIESFVDRISKGEKFTTPEDLQFYENNKKGIESGLLDKQKLETTQSEIDTLTQERDTKIKEASKPDLKLDFVEEDNIPKVETDATYKGEVIGKKKVPNPEFVEKQNAIKEKFNKLKNLIDCLTA